MQDRRPSPLKRRAKFVAGGSVVAVALASLLVWGMSRPGAAAFYMTTSELHALGPTGEQSYRVNGVVVSDSIRKDGLTTSFAITDGRKELRVTTARPLPDTFKDGSEVVALGTFDGSVFEATEVLAKCPSKFKARD